MHAQSSDKSVVVGSGLRNRVAVRIDLCQLTAAYKMLQALGEFLACGAMESQLPHQLLEAGGSFWLPCNLLQDGGIGEFVQDRGIVCSSIHNTLTLPIARAR